MSQVAGLPSSRERSRRAGEKKRGSERFPVVSSLCPRKRWRLPMVKRGRKIWHLSLRGTDECESGGVPPNALLVPAKARLAADGEAWSKDLASFATDDGGVGIEVTNAKAFTMK